MMETLPPRSPRITALRTPEYHIELDEFLGVIWGHVVVSRWGPRTARRLVADSWHMQRALGLPVLFADHFASQGAKHLKFLKLLGFVPCEEPPEVHTDVGVASVYYRFLENQP